MAPGAAEVSEWAMTSPTSVLMRRGPHRVVEIMIDIGDAIGDANHLAFERGRLARHRVGDARTELGVTKNAVPDRKRQVETTPVPFQMIDDAQTLLVVSKAGEGLG